METITIDRMWEYFQWLTELDTLASEESFRIFQEEVEPGHYINHPGYRYRVQINYNHEH